MHLQKFIKVNFNWCNENQWYRRKIAYTKFLSRSTIRSPNGRVLIFYRETAGGKKGQGASANLWAIDITGYNEVKIKTPQMHRPSWSGLLSK